MILSAQDITGHLLKAPGLPLGYLRAAREEALARLKLDCDGRLDAELEHIANWDERTGSSKVAVLHWLTQRELFVTAEFLNAFYAICARIARLEREACGCYIPPNLQTA